MVENDVYETKKKFRKRDRFLAFYKMSSSMSKYINIENLILNSKR
jgi:RNase P/RNase MRP subunit POP5